MNGVIGQVDDIHPIGGGVVLDRDWVVQWLEGVRELKHELCWFREILHLGGQGRGVGGPGRG
jgi:hypothetical protein